MCLFTKNENRILNCAEYTEAVLIFQKLNTQSQQRGAVAQGRSLSPYRLRYIEEWIAYRPCGKLLLG
ncbi:MAG: hypothetical protein LBK06_07305 [Planctomycetaceae bacterium]|nr:hypothetical protein [Planctomycetaceae bacterium]